MAALLCAAPAMAQLGVGAAAAPRPDGSIQPPAGAMPVVDSVPFGPQNIVFGNGRDGDPGLIPNHPPIDQVPPMPMSEPQPSLGRATDSVMVHDGTNNQTWEVPVVPASGAQGGSGGGFNGVDGFVVPAEMARNFGSMSAAGSLGSFPRSPNCRLLMRFVDTNGASWYYVCSGAMQDAGMVMCAAHCVYFRGFPSGGAFPINNWASEIWVYPAWDGAGNSLPNNTDVIQNFGWTHSTFFGAGSDYVSSGNFDADFGIVMMGHGTERHVGMLTGWFGWAWGFDCGTIQGRTYSNFSYPAEGCGGGLHTGATMYYWQGGWDACPGNQLQLFTTPGCFTAVWGGMSGSNAYYLDNGNRLAHAVCSTSNRSTRGQYCKMWEGWHNFMETERGVVRGNSFDLEAFRFRLNGTTTIQATTSAGGSVFVSGNVSNADPANNTYTYRVYLSTNNDISASDTLLGTFSYGFDYAPMQGITINVPAVTIPNVTPGTYWMGVILDAGTDGFTGNNDTNTWDAQQIQVTTAPPPAPGNNNCASAFGYTIGNTVFGTTSNATSDGSSTCPGNGSPDVWYVLTAPSCGTVHFDTCGSLYDTVLSAHAVCGGASIACNDDNANGGNNACGGGLQSGFNMAVTAGTAYRIRVAGFNGASGNFQLNSFYVEPANDDCPNALPYSAGSNTSGCLGGATNDGAAACGASGTSGDVWYSMTPNLSGYLRMDTCGSAFDTVLSVHSACPGTTSNQLACNDDNGNGGNGACGGGLQSGFDIGVVAGTTYYIRVAAFGGSIGAGTFNLHSAFIAPPNDLCSNALTYNIGTTVVGFTTAATVDGGASCGITANSPDVWYRITGACGGLLNITTCGSGGLDTVISVHTGCPGNTANQVACNDDAFVAGCGFRDSEINFQSVAGATYYIRVCGYNGSSGLFHLGSHYVSPGADDCQDAPLIGDGSFVYTNCAATTDGPSEVLCQNDVGQNNNDIWFRYNAAICGHLTVQTCGSPTPTYDTKITAYAGGCPFDDNTALACNDDFCDGVRSSITFPISAGVSYLLRVGGYSTSRGTATLNIHATAGGTCGSADFNCDGDLGTDSDISSFFACLAGNCPPAPCCSSADFNGDGDIGTDSDIAAFFRVLSGGSC